MNLLDTSQVLAYFSPPRSDKHSSITHSSFSMTAFANLSLFTLPNKSPSTGPHLVLHRYHVCTLHLAFSSPSITNLSRHHYFLTSTSIHAPIQSFPFPPPLLPTKYQSNLVFFFLFCSLTHTSPLGGFTWCLSPSSSQ